MPNFYAYYDDNGNIIKTYSGEHGSAQVDDGCAGYINLSGVAVDGDLFKDYKVVNGSLAVKTHEEMKPHYLPSVIEQINEYRAKLKDLPIEYDGGVFDADQEARDNIQGRILELQSKLQLNIFVPTESLVWRDHANNDRNWSNVSDYVEWLQGLAIAIADRKLMIYQVSWQKKQELSSLQTIYDIQNYDIELGWI